MIELEYKYTLVDDRQMSRLLSLSERKLPVQELAAFYFDDREGTLSAKLISIRLRRENATWLLTIKAPLESEQSSDDPASQARYEWTLAQWQADEYPLHDDLRNEARLLAALPEWLAEGMARLADTMDDPVVLAAFTRVQAIVSAVPPTDWLWIGGTDITRRGIVLSKDEHNWHLTVDVGSLFSGDLEEACLEVELELSDPLQTPREVDMVHPLAEHPIMAYLRPETSTKHERVLRLYATRRAAKDASEN